jgi:hypothetical protein
MLFMLATTSVSESAVVNLAWIKTRRPADDASKKMQRSNGLRGTRRPADGLFVHKHPPGLENKGIKRKTPPGGGVSMSK